MKIIFLSNYFNHHQKPVSEAFYQKIGENYVFIETSEMTEERKNMGWTVYEKPKYVKYFYQNKHVEEECQKLIDTADVIIFGSAPNKLIKNVKKNAIIFRYSERPIKTKKNYLFKYPIRLVKWHLQNKKRYNIYLLCSSAFTSLDYSKFGLFKNRAYKWGYFPKTVYYKDVNKMIEKKDSNTILWVARMIGLKHPADAIEVVHRLDEENIDFRLTMIGEGEEVEKVKSLVKKYNLEQKVNLIGFVDSEKVRYYMEKSEIFLFTSDHTEGWGAVLNEAMNSACAVVANARIGSAPYLINNYINGLLYDENDIDKLYENTKYLIQNKSKRENIARNAYETIINEWNAKTAVEKLLMLINNLQNNISEIKNSNYGVCSKADIFEDNWFEKRGK